MLDKRSQNYASYLSCLDACRRKLGGNRIRTAQSLRKQMEENRSADAGRKIVDKIWMTMNWATYDGDVPIMKALGWRSTTWWRSRSAWEMATDPYQRHTMEVQIRIPQQRSAVEHADVELGGRRERLDTAHGTRVGPQGTRDDQSAHDDDTSGGKKNRERRRRNDEETKRPGTLGNREARGGQEIDDSKTNVVLGQWPCQPKDEGKYHHECPESPGRVVEPRAGFTTT